METLTPFTRAMQRLFEASEEYACLALDILNWEHADEATRYLERQERFVRGLRPVEDDAHE